MVLVPDSARSPVLAGLVNREQQLREHLLQRMWGADQKPPEFAAMSLQRFSPLAAVVFERAGSDKRRIVSEMDLLRSELAPLRSRLRVAEEQMFVGKGQEVLDARNEWALVVDEIGRRFGNEPHLISLDGILKLGREAGEVADGPKKTKAWIATLTGLPFDVVRRIITRRGAIELHNLQKDLPAPTRLARSIRTLFGPAIAE